MSFIKGRLRSLEERSRGGRCQECGGYTMNDRRFAGRWQGATEITLRVYIPPGRAALAKLQMVDACREIVPYSQTLLSDIAFDAYFTGHEAGSRHA